MTATTAPTTLISGGTIHQSFLPARTVECLVVSDGRIVHAGGLDEARDRFGDVDHHVDLEGRTVIPGLVESHAHTVFSGMISQWADLRPEATGSVEEIVRAVRDFGPQDGWYRGWGYDDTLLTEQRHPDRHDLDRVSADTPVLITHISGHFAVANSAALAVCGIDASTPDPPEGRYIRDEDGSPTGLLWEVGAVRTARDQCPPPSKADGLRAATEVMSAAVAKGITQIHDLGIGSQLAEAEFDLLRELAESGRMPVRMYGFVRGDLTDALLEDDPDVMGRTFGDRLTIAGVKLWADGSIQGLSASLIEPYHCCPDSRGDLLLTTADIVERARPHIESGAQIAIHANGDHAVAEVIAAYEQLPAPRHGRAGHRIEHFQMAHADHVAACARADIGVSVFANHIHYWGDRHRDRFIGPERAGRMNPVKECLDSGLRTGLHSDSPITPMDMFATMDTSTTRRTRDDHTLGGEQAVTPEEALHIATASSAALVGQQDAVGTLTAGKLADLVVLSQDPLDGTVQAPSTGTFSADHVEATMVGGTWVYER